MLALLLVLTFLAICSSDADTADDTDDNTDDDSYNVYDEADGDEE